LQIVFYGLNRREAAIQSVLNGVSDVVMIAGQLFQEYIARGRFRAADFMYVGPESVVPATQPAADNIFTKKLPRPGTFLSSMPCEFCSAGLTFQT
jgi:hypothetical protein